MTQIEQMVTRVMCHFHPTFRDIEIEELGKRVAHCERLAAAPDTSTLTRPTFLGYARQYRERQAYLLELSRRYAAGSPILSFQLSQLYRSGMKAAWRSLVFGLVAASIFPLPSLLSQKVAVMIVRGLLPELLDDETKPWTKKHEQPRPGTPS